MGVLDCCPPAPWILSAARAARLTPPIPVRFPSEVVHEVKRRAEADDRSVASWIRAVEYELNRTA
ncbi:Arc family DNA-binding protein [Streptomyces scopuliridis]|uniref:Arc family DNA-binding protein n=1 Tax=Streptomyces scopuliridis TaxID=452529 RepID=UPI00068D61B1